MNKWATNIYKEVMSRWTSNSLKKNETSLGYSFLTKIFRVKHSIVQVLQASSV